jgi:uncharacterized protein YbjT (DUF2867 family)
MHIPPTILVVGATGALGRPVVQRLRERGIAVRALCRHPAQAADLAALGAEVIAGDLIDPASMKRACAGVQRVLAAAHGFLGRGRWTSQRVDLEGHRRLFDAAREAGVERLVYTSAFGASAQHPVDFFRHKHEAELALKASGLAHVTLRPTAFMEHHVHNFNGKGLLEKGKAQLIGPGTKKRNFVAATDVAHFAVLSLLADPKPFDTIEIGGPGHFSAVEITRMYAQAAGVPPRTTHLPVGAARVLASLSTPFHPGMARVMRMFSLPDSAIDERFEGAAALEREHAIRMTTVEDFVRQQVAVARR